MIKDLPASAGDTRSIPGSGRSPGGGNGNPLQYSCLENHHGQRSLVGYSPWVCKVLGTTQQVNNSKRENWRAHLKVYVAQIYWDSCHRDLPPALLALHSCLKYLSGPAAFPQGPSWRPCITWGCWEQTCWTSASTRGTTEAAWSSTDCRQRCRFTPRPFAAWCCWSIIESIPTVALKEVS